MSSQDRMILKRYVAESLNEAYLMARNELGPEAIIITTKPVTEHKWGGLYTRELVELTAAAPTQHEAGPRPADRPGLSQEVRPAGSGRALEAYRSQGTAIEPAVPDRGPGQSAGTASSRRSRPGTRPCAPSTRSSPTASDAADADPGETQNEREETDQRDRLIQDMLQVMIDKKTAAGLTNTRSNSNSSSANPVPPPTPPPGPPQAARASSGATRTPGIPFPPAPSTLPAPAGAPTLALPDPLAAVASLALPQPLAEAAGRVELPIDQIARQIDEVHRLLRHLQQQAAQVLQQRPPDSLPSGLLELRQLLTRFETPADTLEALLRGIEEITPAHQLADVTAIRSALGQILQTRLRFGLPTLARGGGKGPEILTIIGPTGVGKTTTLAKLAAVLGLDPRERRSVALFTLDTYRIGATTQLNQYASIIEVPLEVICEPDDIPAALERHQDKDLILVDTVGRCQRNKTELDELRQFLDRFPRGHRFLALAATTKFSDMVEREKRFGEVGYHHLIFTKLDETTSIGPLLALLWQTRANLAYVTDGQDVPDDLRPASLDFFWRWMFPE